MRSPSSPRSITPRRERPISRWISTVRPSGRPRLTSRWRAFAGRGREHPVLRRQPTPSLPVHPARNALLGGCGADHPRLPHLDQHGPGGGAHEVRLDRRGADLPGVAFVAARGRARHGRHHSRAATVAVRLRALVISNMRPDAANPGRGSFVRDQVAALRRIDGLEVELYEFGPGPRALARAAVELRRRHGPPSTLTAARPRRASTSCTRTSGSRPGPRWRCRPRCER